MVRHEYLQKQRCEDKHARHRVPIEAADEFSTSPIAATSAAMLRVFGINSSTTPLRTLGGNAVLIFAANPRPVTRPIRPHID